MAVNLQLTDSTLFLLNGTALFQDGTVAAVFAPSAQDYFAHGNFLTSTSEVALPLGSLSAPFYMGIFKNMDTQNNIKVKAAMSGTVLLNLPPGATGRIWFDSTITAPTCQAVAGTPALRYALFLP